MKTSTLGAFLSLLIAGPAFASGVSGQYYGSWQESARYGRISGAAQFMASVTLKQKGKSLTITSRYSKETAAKLGAKIIGDTQTSRGRKLQLSIKVPQVARTFATSTGSLIGENLTNHFQRTGVQVHLDNASVSLAATLRLENDGSLQLKWSGPATFHASAHPEPYTNAPAEVKAISKRLANGSHTMTIKGSFSARR